MGVYLCMLERCALQLLHCTHTKCICKNLLMCHQNILKQPEFCSKKISDLPLVRVKANNIGTDVKMIQNFHPYGSISKRKKRETITFEAWVFLYHLFMTVFEECQMYEKYQKLETQQLMSSAGPVKHRSKNRGTNRKILSQAQSHVYFLKLFLGSQLRWHF